MNNEEPDEEVLTDAELTEVLAKATETTPQEIVRGAENLDIEPPPDETTTEN